MWPWICQSLVPAIPWPLSGLELEMPWKQNPLKCNLNGSSGSLGNSRIPGDLETFWDLMAREPAPNLLLSITHPIQRESNVAA